MLNYLFIYFGHGGGIWMWRKLDYIKLIIWFNFYFFGHGAFIVEPRWTLPINRSLLSKSLIHDCTLSLLCRSSYCLIHLCSPLLSFLACILVHYCHYNIQVCCCCNTWIKCCIQPFCIQHSSIPTASTYVGASLVLHLSLLQPFKTVLQLYYCCIGL